MLFFPANKLSRIYSAIILTILFLCTVGVSAQTKKNAADAKKKQPAKVQTNKAQANKTQTKKPEPKQTAKQKIVDTKKQAEDKKRANTRNAEDTKRRAAEEAKQRAADEARRQAALAEQRRRAQAAREAQARRLAFERGLRTETIENIKNDDTDGEDLEVRRAAVAALGNHAGTVVVMEPQTGKVLTIVNQDWAIRKSFKPCSTIKLVTGVAGLNEKKITSDGNISDRRFPMNLDDALAYSNNSYFQTVGKNLGNEKMIAYAQMLGLGAPTGINAKNETGGKLPFGNSNARVYSHGDDFEVTPLQLGVLVSTISNGGKVIVPQIPKTKFERTNFRGAMRYQLKLPSNTLQGVIPGMIGATTYGTARRGFDSSFVAAGKTGSCIGGGSWVGLFASVAPIENPQYAVIVITRGQSERGKYAAAIAGKIYQALKYRIIDNGTNTLAKKIPLDLRPQTKVNAKTSAALDTDEDNDSEDNDVAAIPAPTKQAVAKPVAPPLVRKTAQSAPLNAPARQQSKPAELFPTVVVKVKKSGEPTRPRVVPSNPRVAPND